MDSLNEPLIDILKRQAKQVALKVRYTILMLASDRTEAVASLKDWDLWGPLFVCLLFSLSVGLAANAKYTYDDFVNVWIIFWLGAILTSINCRLLGAKGSIFQFASVIGYCMLTICLMGLLVVALPQSTPSWVKMSLVLLGLLWSTVSCMLVMRDLVAEQKKYLCAYPIFLFYVFLSWYAIIA